MRWKLLYAVLIVSVGLPPSLGFGAEQSKRSSLSLQTVAARDDRFGLKQSPLLHEAIRPEERGETPRDRSKLTSRDLFLPWQDAAKASKQKSDAINVEPWLPMRGALGVKVEVTW